MLPIVLYYAVFVAFEPNNYFGLKDKADGTNIMALLRRYEKTPQDSIILGDSRTARLDMALVEARSGHAWANLSYGGASLEEQLDILDWALAQNPNMKNVLFMGSFYTFNAGYAHNRNVVAASQNAFIYLTNLGYNINMLTNLYDHLSPNRQVAATGETQNPADYVNVPYTVPATGQTVQIREKMAEHLSQLDPRTKGWVLNKEQFQRLLKTISACTAKGVSFTVVLPPASREVMDCLIKPYGIDEKMLPVLTALHATGAQMLDYEFANRDALREDQFYDGFHLDLERGLNAWTEMLLADMAAPKGGAAHGA